MKRWIVAAIESDEDSTRKIYVGKTREEVEAKLIEYYKEVTNCVVEDDLEELEREENMTHEEWWEEIQDGFDAIIVEEVDFA